MSESCFETSQKCTCRQAGHQLDLQVMAAAGGGKKRKKTIRILLMIWTVYMHHQVWS